MHEIRIHEGRKNEWHTGIQIKKDRNTYMGNNEITKQGSGKE